MFLKEVYEGVWAAVCLLFHIVSNSRMVAALLKILQSGIQDLRLLPPKGQPNLDFFKKVFIKAGRFTTQWVRVDFDQIPDFGKTVNLTLPRQGHMISRIYIVVNYPDIVSQQVAAQAAGGENFAGPNFGWTNSLGHAIFQNIQLSIGNVRVEQFDYRLLEILDEFKTPLEKVPLVNQMIQRYDNGFNFKKIGWDPQKRPTQTITPIPFWFSNGDPGSFLPIDALSKDSVQISVTFAPLDSTIVSELVTKTTTTCVKYPKIPYAKFYTYDTNSYYYTNGITPPRTEIPGVTMPGTLPLGDTYMMVEYIYLDKSEANRFRLADITLPITQHYAIEPFDTNNYLEVNIPLQIPNPTRDLFFFAQRTEAPSYNAHFLATRDLSGADAPIAPWWPDAEGLNSQSLSKTYSPAFSKRESEPIASFALVYEGRLVRYGTEAPALFRSILPSIEQRKAPWVNRYYYNLPFGVMHGHLPGSMPSGEANMDKIRRMELQVRLAAPKGNALGSSASRYWIYVYAETYNVLRIYGGRGALLFGY